MSKTILLIEDNPDEILLAKRAFDKAGLDVALAIAEGADAACAMLAEQAPAELPRLILLDLKMQNKNGLAVLRELRAQSHTHTLPVVMLSSSDEPDDIANAYAFGANSYLRKPVNFDAFVQMMRDVHRYWMEHNQLPPPGGEK